MNSNYYNNYDDVIAERKRQVTKEWKPIGCDTMKSVFDHELGHQIDKLLGISKSKDVKEYFETHKMAISKNLLEYATVKVKEFIAEAWSEYNNNPKSRKISKMLAFKVDRKSYFVKSVTIPQRKFSGISSKNKKIEKDN